MHKNLFLSLFFFLVCFITKAQNDSIEKIIKGDSVVLHDTLASILEEYDEENLSDESIARVPDDSTAIQTRSFNIETLNQLTSDKDFQYKATPTVAENLWDRFKQWLSDMLSALFRNAVTTNWGRAFVYLLGLIAGIVVIMLILKVDAFKVFYSGEGKSKINYQVFQENIHEMNFEKLIQEAMSQNDYRKGVRLTFLYALKILSDKNHIRWESGKTNHDYVTELSIPELRTGFNQLNFYFEYAWYGNFTVTPEMFSKVQKVFLSWRDNVR